MALQEPIPVALSGKIIKIFLRIATIPILFLCHSLRTAHRIQKTCVLFFAVLPLFLFRVRIHPLTEDIPISLRRALADATPSLTTLNLYRKKNNTGRIPVIRIHITMMITTTETTAPVRDLFCFRISAAVIGLPGQFPGIVCLGRLPDDPAAGMV